MKLEDYKLNGLGPPPIIQSLSIGEDKIILLDSKNLPPCKQGYRNLLAIDKFENVLWIADLPDNNLYFSYWNVKIDEGQLYALAGSFLCRLDQKNGKVLGWQFVK